MSTKLKSPNQLLASARLMIANSAVPAGDAAEVVRRRGNRAARATRRSPFTCVCGQLPAWRPCFARVSASTGLRARVARILDRAMVDKTLDVTAPLKHVTGYAACRNDSCTAWEMRCCVASSISEYIGRLNTCFASPLLTGVPSLRHSFS
jgi:hypothetical protein